MEAVRWGVLGASGHFFLRVAAPLGRTDSVCLHGIASRSAERAKSAAERCGIAKWYGSYGELVEDPEIEAVYIPLPNHLHAEWIKKAADAGKHILCEKPLAMNAHEARECVEYAQKRGVLLMEAFMYKFHPQWVKAAEIVRTGEIGAVNSVHSVFSYMNKDAANIRNQLAAGGGALMDIGCYTVSAPRFLLGAEPVRALSLVERDRAFQTDILSSGILDFGGARALFTVGTQTAPAQRVEVYGSAGALLIHLPFNMYPDVPAKVTVKTGVGIRELLLGPGDQYGLEFEAFSEAVRGGGSAPVDPEDAVGNQKVLDALFRSEASGDWEVV